MRLQMQGVMSFLERFFIFGIMSLSVCVCMQAHVWHMHVCMRVQDEKDLPYLYVLTADLQHPHRC